MLVLKKIRKKYHTLRQTIACHLGETFTELRIGKNPFGLGDATFIADYCATTGEYIREKIYFENAEGIKKDIAGLCGILEKLSINNFYSEDEKHKQNIQIS